MLTLLNSPDLMCPLCLSRLFSDRLALPLTSSCLVFGLCLGLAPRLPLHLVLTSSCLALPPKPGLSSFCCWCSLVHLHLARTLILTSHSSVPSLSFQLPSSSPVCYFNPRPSVPRHSNVPATSFETSRHPAVAKQLSLGRTVPSLHSGLGTLKSTLAFLTHSAQLAPGLYLSPFASPCP